MFTKKQSGPFKNTSVNITEAQKIAIKELNIDFSSLIRFLLDRYLIQNYSDQYEKIKKRGGKF